MVMPGKTKQKITYPDYGARSMRVLEALTPLSGALPPVTHADYIGQIYVETSTPALYISVTKGSLIAANDWSLSNIAALPAAVNTAVNTAVAAAVEDLRPLAGILAPAAHADYIGQIFVDTVATKTYMAIATDSEIIADDWKQITFVA